MTADSKIILDDSLKHIAIIMDGNGRWANKRGLPREIGHKHGAQTFRKILDYCGEIGLKELTVYAFSTENHKRPQREVDSIISLLKQYIGECERSMSKNDVYCRFIGDVSCLDENTKARISKIEENTRGKSLTLNIAFNYGGRSEITRAFNTLVAEGKTEITEQDISEHLYTDAGHDPDLIIRTGGEMRLSNFLLWQAAYAEFYVTDTLWPDFNEKDLYCAIENFYSRKRRYGGI